MLFNKGALGSYSLELSDIAADLGIVAGAVVLGVLFPPSLAATAAALSATEAEVALGGNLTAALLAMASGAFWRGSNEVQRYVNDPPREDFDKVLTFDFYPDWPAATQAARVLAAMTITVERFNGARAALQPKKAGAAGGVALQAAALARNGQACMFQFAALQKALEVLRQQSSVLLDTRILERQKMLLTGQVLFRRLSVNFALVLPFKDSSEAAEPHCSTPSAIKLSDAPRRSEAPPR